MESPGDPSWCSTALPSLAATPLPECQPPPPCPTPVPPEPRDPEFGVPSATVEEPLPFLPVLCCSRKTADAKVPQKISIDAPSSPPRTGFSENISRAFIEELRLALEDNTKLMASTLQKFQKRQQVFFNRQEQVLENFVVSADDVSASCGRGGTPPGSGRRKPRFAHKNEDNLSEAGTSPRSKWQALRKSVRLMSDEHPPTPTLDSSRLDKSSGSEKSEVKAEHVEGAMTDRDDEGQVIGDTTEEDVHRKPPLRKSASSRSKQPTKVMRKQRSDATGPGEGDMHREKPNKPTAKKAQEAQEITARFVKDGRCYDDDSILLAAPKLPIVKLQEQVEDALDGVPISDGLKHCLGHINMRWYRFVKSPCFTLTTNILIFSNVAFIAVQAQHAVDTAVAGVPHDFAMQAIDGFYSAFFLFELLLRLFAERLSFFICDDRRWNIMDVLFVLIDIINALLDSDSLVGYWAGLRGAVRGVRLARAMRALRLLRALQTWRRARLMVDEVTRSFGVLCMVFIIFGVIMLFFGVVFMQATADSILGDEVSEEGRAELLRRFRTIGMAIVSLFQASSGGRAWGPEWESVREVSSMYGLIFIGYIALSVLAVFNVVTSTFVESALGLAKKIEADNKAQISADLRYNLIESLNIQKNGAASWEVLVAHLRHPEVTDQLVELGLDYSEMRDIFDLCDVNGVNQVAIMELSQACARFTRPVRSVDFLTVLLSLRTLLQETWATRAIVENMHSNSKHT